MNTNMFYFLTYLGDWPAVEAAVMCGATSTTGESESRPSSPAPNQSGTTLLDKFTHALIVKCTNEVIIVFFNINLILYIFANNALSLSRCLTRCYIH
jgi:hypothetical protein